MARRPQRTRYPGMVTAGVGTAAVLCLWGSFAFYGFESSYQQQSSDPYMVSAQAARLGPLVAVVPDSARLGYITDAQPASVLDTAMFLSAQYALAPRLLERSTTEELVLGNFSRPADFATIGGQMGLRIEQNFGNGVVLYGRGDR